MKKIVDKLPKKSDIRAEIFEGTLERNSGEVIREASSEQLGVISGALFEIISDKILDNSSHNYHN